LGIVLKKKIGCSVKRNYEKRVIREFFRLNKSILDENYDLIFLLKKPNSQFYAKQTDFIEIIKNI
jgi:ribonuclease P protein component